MRCSDYHTLINRGRKAGLGTRELYSALTARRPESGDQARGGADENGFVPAYDHGQRIYQPAGHIPRP